MIKVDVISGFLGAGKTTLIKKLLKASENEKVILIENEFGDIGIDGEIIEREGFKVYELAKGCICCTIKTDFVNLLNKIIEEYEPDRIIIEPTGVNILSEIIDVLLKDNFKNICEINSLITVIDSINYLDHIEAFGEFFEDQIKNANILILSKGQFSDDITIQKIVESLRELNSEASIITEPWNELSYEEIRNLLVVELKTDFKELFSSGCNPSIDNKFHTFGIKTVARFSEEKLEEILAKLKEGSYGNIIRAKGFVKGITEDLEFSFAGSSYEICKYSGENPGILCIIGQDLKEKDIKKLFKFSIGSLNKW